MTDPQRDTESRCLDHRMELPCAICALAQSNLDIERLGKGLPPRKASVGDTESVAPKLPPIIEEHLNVPFTFTPDTESVAGLTEKAQKLMAEHVAPSMVAPSKEVTDAYAWGQAAGLMEAAAALTRLEGIETSRELWKNRATEQATRIQELSGALASFVDVESEICAFVDKDTAAVYTELCEAARAALTKQGEK